MVGGKGVAHVSYSSYEQGCDIPLMNGDGEADEDDGDAIVANEVYYL